MLKQYKSILYLVICSCLCLNFYTCGQWGAIQSYAMYTDSTKFHKIFDSLYGEKSSYYPQDKWLLEYKETCLYNNHLNIRMLYFKEKNVMLMFTTRKAENNYGNKFYNITLRSVITEQNGKLKFHQEDNLSETEIEKYKHFIKINILDKLGFEYKPYSNY